MNCEDARVVLHGYLDGELDPSRSLEFEAHLRGCDRCKAEFTKYQALSSTIRNSAQYFKAPEDFRSRIVSEMRRSDRSRLPIQRISARWQVLVGSIAAILVASFGLNAILARRSTESLIAQEVVASHARSLMANHLVDVASSDRHTVKPWLDKNLDFAPIVEDFAPHGFALIGGRLDYLDHRQVAALVYRHRQHVVNLFIWPATNAADSAPHWLSQRGYNIAYWTDSGMNYWAISDADRSGLGDFVEMVRGGASHAPK
jgi:anti-sigma factor (TIGR02949 family)